MCEREYIYRREDAMTLKQLFDKFASTLPQIVVVADGFSFNACEMEISSGEVLLLHSCGWQERALVHDSLKRTLSIPLDYRHRFSFVKFPGENLQLRHMVKYELPLEVKFTDWENLHFRNTNRAAMSRLTVVKVHSVPYFLASPVCPGCKGVPDSARTIPLPIYLKQVSFCPVMEVKDTHGGSQLYEPIVRNLTQQLDHTYTSILTGDKEIIQLSSKPITNSKNLNSSITENTYILIAKARAMSQDQAKIRGAPKTALKPPHLKKLGHHGNKPADSSSGNALQNPTQADSKELKTFSSFKPPTEDERVFTFERSSMHVPTEAERTSPKSPLMQTSTYENGMSLRKQMSGETPASPQTAAPNTSPLSLFPSQCDVSMPLPPPPPEALADDTLPLPPPPDMDLDSTFPPPPPPWDVAAGNQHPARSNTAVSSSHRLPSSRQPLAERERVPAVQDTDSKWSLSDRPPPLPPRRGILKACNTPSPPTESSGSYQNTPPQSSAQAPVGRVSTQGHPSPSPKPRRRLAVPRQVPPTPDFPPPPPATRAEAKTPSRSASSAAAVRVKVDLSSKGKKSPSAPPLPCGRSSPLLRRRCSVGLPPVSPPSLGASLPAPSASCNRESDSVEHIYEEIPDIFVRRSQSLDSPAVTSPSPAKKSSQKSVSLMSELKGRMSKARSKSPGPGKSWTASMMGNLVEVETSESLSEGSGSSSYVIAQAPSVGQTVAWERTRAACVENPKGTPAQEKSVARKTGEEAASTERSGHRTLPKPPKRPIMTLVGEESCVTSHGSLDRRQRHYSKLPSRVGVAKEQSSLVTDQSTTPGPCHPTTSALEQMTMDDVTEVLAQLNLDKYTGSFKRHLVDGVILKQLSTETLREDFGMSRLEAIRLSTFIDRGHLPK